MFHCDLTLPSPEENLACDEALLDLCEAGEADELLRLWEPAQHFVVVGYANRVATEVNLPFCREHAIPVLRRCTGGGTVLQGPGCLNYSLVLRIEDGGPLRNVSAANKFIMERQRQALSQLLKAQVEVQGHTDLAIDGRKFSGNAQRRRKHFLLFHGSFLLGLDLALVEKTLQMPSKQPDYRAHRTHGDFLMNLEIPSHLVKTALLVAWEASQPWSKIPSEQINSLVREKYALDEWILRF